MIDGHRNIVLQVVVAAAGVALVLLILVILLGFHERAVITDRICHVQTTDRRALRGSFIIARQFTLTSRVRTYSERQRFQEFYTHLLAQTPALKCVGGRPVPIKEGTS